ncbi:MAG: hypothetical protein CMH22_11440 [Methylophaga sp.]|nr:hypothetical protein [Methylophaga sp.]
MANVGSGLKAQHEYTTPKGDTRGAPDIIRLNMHLMLINQNYGRTVILPILIPRKFFSNCSNGFISSIYSGSVYEEPNQT